MIRCLRVFARVSACVLKAMGLVWPLGASARPQARRQGTMLSGWHPLEAFAIRNCLAWSVSVRVSCARAKAMGFACVFARVRACVLKQGMARTAKEATNACYLQHFGLSGRYRKPRMHAIYSALSSQGWVGPPRKRRMHAIYSTLGPQGGIGRKGDECMLFIARCALREVSEATNACYL